MSAASSSLLVMFCIACAGGVIVCSIRAWQVHQKNKKHRDRLARWDEMVVWSIENQGPHSIFIKSDELGGGHVIIDNGQHNVILKRKDDDAI